MLTSLFRRLRPVVRCIGTHGHSVLAVALLLTLASTPLALRLEIDAELSNLLPSEYPAIQALERLRETIGGEEDVAVAISSPDFAANRAFSETLIDAAMKLRSPEGEPYFSRCEYRRDTGFLERNALYFATGEELDVLEEYLDVRMARARLESSPLYLGLGEGTSEEDALARSLESTYDRLVPGEYPVSADSTVLAVRFHPAVSQTDFARIRKLYAALDSLAAALEPEKFHPAMEVTTAGRLLRRLHEIRAISSDVGRSFGAGVLAVLVTVVLYFSYKSKAPSGARSRAADLAAVVGRMPVLAVVIGLPFLMSLSWTFAVTYLWLGVLNLMTSTLALLLFGLGIDYGIHFFARYAEERRNGLDVPAAIEVTFASTGQAIAVGAMTTAGGLAVLVLGDFRGFSHFGLIAAIGIAFALLAMTVVMPALVAVCEQLGLLSLGPRAPDHARAPGNGRFPLAGLVTAAALASVLVGILAFPGTGFEYRFGELEPVYGEYNERRDRIRQVFPPTGSRNQAYIIADSPSKARAAAAAVRAHAATDTLTPTIAGVATLQDRYPVEPADKQRKLRRIAAIRSRLDEPLLRASGGEQLARLRLAAGTRAPLSPDDLPASLKDPFLDRNGEIGHFVVVSPSVGLSDGRNSIAFLEDVGTVRGADGTVFHAGSPALAAAAILRRVRGESPWMVAGSALLVMLLMWLNFSSLRWAAVALLPLLVGVLWMVIAMAVFDLRLNFYNMIVLPAVLGIGNDAGAHLAHRYREEGPGSIRRVLASTGEHITVGSLTTAIAFAGPLLSFHPGLRTIGLLALTGLGTTWLAALVVTPAVLQFLSDRGQLPGLNPPRETGSGRSPYPAGTPA